MDQVVLIVGHTILRINRPTWINATAGFKGKVSANPGALTFGPSQGVSTLSIGGKYYNYTVSDGKVVLNGYDTPTNHKADYLEFTYTTTGPAAGGKTLLVKAFRDI